MNTELTISPLEKSFSMNFTDMDELLDFIEFKMVELGDLIDCDVNHRFSPGVYTREAKAPAESLIMSMKHKTQHQFCLIKGKCAVFTHGVGWEMMTEGFIGETQPGARRLIYVFEDVIWWSIHPTDKTDVKEIEMDIIDNRTNKFITECLGQQS